VYVVPIAPEIVLYFGGNVQLNFYRRFNELLRQLITAKPIAIKIAATIRVMFHSGILQGSYSRLDRYRRCDHLHGLNCEALRKKIVLQRDSI